MQTHCYIIVFVGFSVGSCINIGYTIKLKNLRDLDVHGNLYKHPRSKHKCVYGFQGDVCVHINYVGPEDFIVKVFIL